MNVSIEILLLMIKVSIPPNAISTGAEPISEIADFLQQDEQEFLQILETELDQLICEPSESVVKKILTYASLF